MGGKRRRSDGGGGNIRKKRSSQSKQTLARVAERKEAAEEKLQRRLAAAEALSRHRSSAPHPVPSPAASPPAPLPADEPDDPAKARYAERRAAVYPELVAGLASSLFNDAAPPEPRHAPEKLEAAGNAVRAEPTVLTAEEGDQGAAATFSAADTEEEASLEQENVAAVARENAHFGSSVTPGDAPGKLAAVCVVPGVGRVSASVAEPRRAELERQLEGGLGDVTVRALGLQPSLYAKWRALQAADGRGEALGKVSRAFVVPLREYHDMFLCRVLKDAEEDELRRVYVAHCLAHVLRGRARVLRNDAVLKKSPGAADAPKDQGFSRARVLMLLPMKNTAYDVVKMLTALAVGAEDGEKDVSHIANSERFENEFGPDPEEEAGQEMDTKDEHIAGIGKRARKPADHRRVFRGNIDDDFKLGIAFTKKAVRLYADFYASDIIIASPLGLRRAMAEKVSGNSAHSRLSKEDEDGDKEWKTGIGSATEKPKPDDTDDGFLSSIEICIMDGAHVFSMQNWHTLCKAVDMMNKIPASTRDTDFSRLRDWCLDELMRNFRQTVVLSQYRKSEFVSLMRDFSNHSGRVQILEPPRDRGTMTDVAVSLRQTFFRIPNVESPASAPEKRFSFFFSNTMPMLRSLVNSQALVFIPSYFDYVRVRNRLLRYAEDDSSFRFASMCEYSKGADISRARARLYDRTVSLVLMTERFHFFWRHWIRGANTIVWYGLPENAGYYPEILNMTAEAAEMGRSVQALALYDDLDSFRLEGVVGQGRCRKMTSKSSRSVYLFV